MVVYLLTKVTGHSRAGMQRKIQKLKNNRVKVRQVSNLFRIFASDINNMVMGNSRTITIKNPSRKLEEKIREAGVQKYLWLKELCSEETKPNKVIYV